MGNLDHTVKSLLVNLSLLALSLVFACSEAPEPSEQALMDYASRQQKSSPSALKNSGETPSELATRAFVTVVSGRDIPDMDDGPGVTDAYVVLAYDGARFESSVSDADEEDGAMWGDRFVLDLVSGGVLTVTLMDEDTTGDEILGVASEPMAPMPAGTKREVELSFRDGRRGVVLLRVEALVEAP